MIIPWKIMDKFSCICLILLCGNIFPIKLYYNNYFVKQNSDLVNVTLSMENSKKGILVNYYEDLKIRVDFVWVIRHSKLLIPRGFDQNFLIIQDEFYMWRQ
jgi:hypothetical protein